MLFAFILLLLIPCVPTLLSATIFYAIDGGFNKNQIKFFGIGLLLVTILKHIIGFGCLF